MMLSRRAVGSARRWVATPAKDVSGRNGRVCAVLGGQWGDEGEGKAAITDKTVRISIRGANKEMGTIANLEEIGKIAHENDVLFHTDAAQAVGHIPIDVKKMNIDLMSVSSH